MGARELDMTGPDPVHEMAYRRILNHVKNHKKTVDAWVAAGPHRMAGNWILAAVKKEPDFARLRGLWLEDEEFRGYLKGKLTFHFGADYTKQLIALFLA